MAPRRAPRLIDVAETAGVSIATASRALAGTNGVSEAMAERVRQIAAELGYVANAHARSLASGASSSVGLIVHEIDDPYFTEIASGVLGLASERALAVQICHSGRDPRVELAQIRSLVANRTGSIIVAGSGHVDPSVEADARAELARFQADGGRVAMIGRHHVAADAVLPDNHAGGRAIAEHVLSLGHRRIAIASGSQGLTTIADRMAGIQEALAAGGRRATKPLLVEAEFTREGGMAAAREILNTAPDTTAILALNDAMAIGVLAVLRERGLACPGDVSVSGFDDVAVAAHLGPSLTTVRLPMEEFGRLALGMTLQPVASRPRKKHTPHELVVRDSTAPPPG
ncbi:MAG: LacI family transcriptional regulator [Actinomycetota bacterium]|nr:LacI family transcriptional regulator [Actinomycetota bacterium]